MARPFMPAPDEWAIVEYEVVMYRSTHAILLDPQQFNPLPRVLKNVVEESAVLHARILCDVFLSRGIGADDIKLSELFNGWHTHPDYSRIRRAVRDLRALYGSSTVENTPCWVFNKMLAHPTRRRGVIFDYDEILADLQPYLVAIIEEIERLRQTAFKTKTIE